MENAFSSFLDRIYRIVRIPFGRSPDENGQPQSPAAGFKASSKISVSF